MVRRIRVFAGPNGSGKSILYKGLLEKKYFNEYCYINADMLQEKLQIGIDFKNEFGVELLKDEIIQTFNANFAKNEKQKLLPTDFISKDSKLIFVGESDFKSYIAAVIADLLRYKLIESKHTSFSFETVLSHPSKIELLKFAKEQGFKIYCYFIATEDPCINQKRVIERVAKGGHSVPSDKIAQRYYRTMELLPKLIAIADKAYLFDNSNSIETGYQYIANTNKDNKKLSMTCNEMPNWLFSYMIRPVFNKNP